MHYLRRKHTAWRRKRCLRKGHPMAPWSPVVCAFKEPGHIIDGEVIEGRMFVERAWRCALHDGAEVWEVHP